MSLLLFSQNLKRSRDSEHISFGVVYIMHTLVGLLLCINQHTKFEVPSFTNSRYDWGKMKKTGHVTLTTPLLSVICHSYAGT